MVEIKEITVKDVVVRLATSHGITRLILAKKGSSQRIQVPLPRPEKISEVLKEWNGK